MVLTVDASASQWITGVSIFMTLTGAALWESPVTHAALITGPARCILDTGTLTGLLVTEVVPCSILMTITC